MCLAKLCISWNTALIYEFVVHWICINTGFGARPQPWASGSRGVSPAKTSFNWFYIFQNCIIYNFWRNLNSPAILFKLMFNLSFWNLLLHSKVYKETCQIICIPNHILVVKAFSMWLKEPISSAFLPWSLLSGSGTWTTPSMNLW